MKNFILGILIGVLLVTGIAAVPVRVVDVSRDKTELNQQIVPKLQRYIELMDADLPRWEALSYEKKKQIIKSDKYLRVKVGWWMFKKLYPWFREAVENGDI